MTNQERLQANNAAIENIQQTLASKMIMPVADYATIEDVENAVKDKATISYVDTKVADLVNSAPETLDTLGEVATAIQNNSNVVDALNSAIGNKVDKVSGKGLSTNDYTTEEKNKLSELSNYNDTELRGLINNKADKTAIPTKVSQLTNDSNYLKSIPSEYVTETELNNKGYATTSQLANKVDKVDGKVLSTNDYTTAEKTKLAGLSNYDDTTIKSQINNKASIADMTAYINEHKDELKGAQGDKGDKGDKGDSYVMTEADKSEITRMIIESLGGNPVFGYVDKDNNIIVSGNLADGDYTLKYEMEDGSFITVGELVLDNVIEYTITKNLTNCSISNNISEVVAGESYSATISANSGYALTSVTVTMGGSSIAVTNGVINIESVTGNIVITAVAEENLEPTNLFDASQGFYGRLSSTGINRTDIDTLFVPGYIKVQQGDIVVIKGCDLAPYFSDGKHHYMTGYDINKANVYTDNAYVTNAYWSVDTLTTTNSQLTVLSDAIEYFRFTLGNPAGYREKIDITKIVINIKRDGKWL